jgi:hypothetical protein
MSEARQDTSTPAGTVGPGVDEIALAFQLHRGRSGLTAVEGLAQILSVPVPNAAGAPITRSMTASCAGEDGDEHLPVSGVFVTTRGAVAVVQQGDSVWSQSEEQT